MIDPIFDEEVHVLSKEYGYIAKKIHEPKPENTLHELIDIQLLKFCEYLYLNDKEKVIDYLMQIFRLQVFHCSTDENFQIIYRPPYMASCLQQYATLCLKFKRSEKDNLENEVTQ